MRTANTLIRLGGCPGWSESSLGAHSFCWFCHVAAQYYYVLKCNLGPACVATSSFAPLSSGYNKAKQCHTVNNPMSGIKTCSASVQNSPIVSQGNRMDTNVTSGLRTVELLFQCPSIAWAAIVLNRCLPSHHLRPVIVIKPWFIFGFVFVLFYCRPRPNYRTLHFRTSTIKARNPYARLRMRFRIRKISKYKGK